MNKITIGKNKFDLDRFARLVQDEGLVIELDAVQLSEVKANHDFLVEFAQNKVIYGVNTGFGPMAQYIIPDEDRKQLQMNLIRSHASGMGEPLPITMCRGIAIARLNTLMLARSGIHANAVELLANMINAQIYPVIFSHGGVGASGDLVQLAHLALSMMGEGEVYYKGNRMETQKAFLVSGITPMNIHIREGLALMNGTSAMTAIGLMNVDRATNLLNWSVCVSTMINEVVASFDDHLSSLLNEAKVHQGQRRIATMMRQLLVDSSCTRNRTDVIYKNSIEKTKLDDKLQEYYSIRCIPQILGPILECIDSARNIVANELNSANDNPLIFHQEKEICHGGNFHGDYVAFEMDKLKIAVTKLSMLMERQLNFLLNDRLNDKLLPFINSGRLGFNFGLQGYQFTATSTVAENQTLSNPMYIHSIPCNNDNQDIVSMGTNAALLTHRVIDNATDVMTIQLIAAVHAIEMSGIKNKMASKTREIFELVRENISISAADKAPHSQLMTVRSLIDSKLIQLDFLNL